MVAEHAARQQKVRNHFKHPPLHTPPVVSPLLEIFRFVVRRPSIAPATHGSVLLEFEQVRDFI
jgi:hypothetical protein